MEGGRGGPGVRTGAVAANGRRASWQKDQELRDMVSRAWSSLALNEQVAVLLGRLAH